MKTDEITVLFARFEAAVHRARGVEFWFARELQVLFDYDRWENFAASIQRACDACTQAGQAVADHFRGVTKMVPLGSGAQRQIEDVALTRYAAYLIAQNGDPRKQTIAFAQTYFAVQTRRQELIELRLVEAERLEARRRLAASEKELSGVIFERLRERDSFARIRSKGDEALFGGWTTRDMKRKLRVPEARPLADFLPAITGDHVANHRELRRALGQRGIRPENLPAEEDARKLERRLQAEKKKLPGRVRRLEIDEGGKEG